MYRFILIALFCTLYVIGCTSKDESSPGVGTPQLSKDDKVIYFQYHEGWNASICRMGIKDSLFEKIVACTNEFSFYKPRLSDDGEKIVFIGKKFEANIDKVFIANADGSSVQGLFTSKHIYEAFLSKNRNEIIFNMADTVAKYSPVARKSAHGYDIFSFDIENKITNKLTNFNSYEINGVSDYKTDSLLYNDKDIDGICAIARNNTSKPRVIIKNDNPGDMNYMYYYPKFVEKYNVIVFQNSYQLYQIMGNNQIKLIYQSDKMIKSFCVFNTLPQILFTLDGEFCFYSINFDGTDLKRIEVNKTNNF
jgi:hypothetical protein